jgi:putative heme iron utilization protein
LNYCCFIAGLVGVCLVPLWAASANVPSFCASPDQATRVRQEYLGLLGQAPSVVAAGLGVTEGTVLSGLPDGQSLGVAPVEFEKVWASLSEWDNAITLIKRDGHEFEIVGPVHTGRYGRDKQRFDLNPVGWGAAGHIMPSNIGAIFAVSLPTRGDAKAQGVLFLNNAGEMSFAAMVPVVSGRSSQTVSKQFGDTWQAMRTMPRVCN